MEDIKKILEQAGWYPNRQISIESMMDGYIQHGYKLPNLIIKRVLEQFGNLRFEYGTDEGFHYDIRVNPDIGMEWIDSTDLPILEKIVGDSLLPIGSINSDHGGLLMSFSGKFYLMGNEGIYYIGSQFFEVCETVFLEKPLQKLGGSNW